MKKFVLAIVISMAACIASFAQSTSMGFQIPQYGQSDWHVPLNYNFNLLDQYLSGARQIPSLSVGSLSSNTVAKPGTCAVNQFVVATTPTGVVCANYSTTWNTQVINGVFYAGIGDYTTIQAAVNAAGTTGSVVIPPSYSGDDGYTNANGILVIDMRNASFAIGKTIALKDGSYAVNPEALYFGAKGDGVTDDSAALQAADTYAAVLGLPLYLPHKYAIAAPVFVSARWRGLAGQSQVIVLPSFVYGSSVTSANQGAVYNAHFSATYNDATADQLEFDSLSFVNNGPITSGGQRETMMLSNVKALKIQNCSFLSSGSTTLTDLDIWGPVRNGLIRGNTFSQNTGASTGGNIWILGLGASSADYTKNIHITDNVFIHNSGDEAVAINNFGAAPVTDIFVDHFTLTETGADSVAFTIVGNGNASYPSRYVKNVHVSDFTLSVAATQNFALRVGAAGETAGATSDVTIDHGVFNLASSHPLIAGIYVPTGANVSVEHNVLNNTGSTVTTAISGNSSTVVNNNRINDTFGAAIGNVAYASGNLVSMTSGKGISCAAQAVANTITALGPAISCDVTGTYYAASNTLSVLAGAAAGTAAVYGYGYNPSQSISFVLDANTINLANAAHYAYSSAASTQHAELRNNVISGTGQTVGVVLDAAANNTWYGQKDDFAASTASLPSLLVPKLPTGFIVKSSAPSGGVFGWQLTTPASSTWKTLTSADGYVTLTPSALQTITGYGLSAPSLYTNSLYTPSGSPGVLNASCGNNSSSPQYGVCFQVQRPSDLAYVFRTTIGKQVFTANSTLDDGSGNAQLGGSLGLKSGSYYGTLSTATLTAARAYTLPDASGSVALTLTATTGSLGGSALAAGACANTLVTVSGATTDKPVVVAPDTYPGDGFFWSGWVSTANTVLVHVCNGAPASATPTATAYHVRVIQ